MSRSSGMDRLQSGSHSDRSCSCLKSRTSPLLELLQLLPPRFSQKYCQYGPIFFISSLNNRGPSASGFLLGCEIFYGYNGSPFSTATTPVPGATALAWRDP